MSLAPSVAVPRASFNPLPLYIGLFCLLWSFAFVAGKIGVTDCPPLILLTARFSLAGILILGISALRGEGFDLTWRDAAVFAILGVANNALYLGLGYTGLQTVSAGLGGLVVSANPVFTAVLAAVFLGERQQPPRIGQQPLAGFRRRHVLRRPIEQRPADIVLQPLDLLADGRLGAVDALPGAGEAAGVDHRDETAQQLQIEHASLHSKIH